MIYCRSHNKIPGLLLAVLLLVTLDALAREDNLPRFELGISMVGLNLPHYRGSAGSSNYLLPLPYLKYRGERFQIDNGIEGILTITEDLILTISGNASAPVDEDSPERVGMEELKGSIEIGPSLDYRLYRARRSSLWLELPLRLAVTFESNPQVIGRVFHPRLAWDKPYLAKGDWKLRFAAGPMYASDEYHDYYYSVDPADALPGRSVFQAEGGYSGIRADFTFSRRFDDIWFGGFIRYDNLNGSVIENSSLVSDNSVWMSGLALTWVFMTR
jgi:outer membrane scaffolding protein for murein synthesis (MipA/OmpV family)